MGSVRFLHWNILYEEKAENILSLVKDLKPDILCCQEINDTNNNLVSMFAKKFAYYYFEPAIIIGATNEKLILGNAIFSRFPMANKRKVFLQNGPNATSGNQHEERIYIEANLDCDGEELTVGTTHLSFTPQFAMTSDKKQQAKNLLEAIKGRQSRFVISGDFNSTPNTSLIKSLNEQFVSAGPPNSEPTFTTIPFSFLGFDVTGLDWRVDFIFTTKDMRVLKSEIVKTKFSDHLPILAELEF